jgi:hypothetical protein
MYFDLPTAKDSVSSLTVIHLTKVLVVTFTAHEAERLLPSFVYAVTTALPVATEDRVPLLTVTTFVLSLHQVSALLVAFEGKNVADSV